LESKSKEDIKDKINPLLYKFFKPEFLNRIDATVIYNKLTEKEIIEISKLQLESVSKRLEENDIKLKINDFLVEYFAKKGYDPLFGARPLKRAVEDELVDKIAMKILENHIKPGDVVEASKNKDGLKVYPVLKN
jgi:ATP-dependent Clp protease ATP-binding subunit ClpA